MSYRTYSWTSASRSKEQRERMTHGFYMSIGNDDPAPKLALAALALAENERDALLILSLTQCQTPETIARAQRFVERDVRASK